MSDIDRTETDEEEELDLEVTLVEPDEHLAEPSPEIQQRIDALLSGNLGFRRSAEKVREFPQSPGVCIHVTLPPVAAITPTRHAELVVPAFGNCTGTTCA